jgi:hypothetical protein
MGRLHHLQQTLPKNLRWTAHLREVEFILLDYSSRDPLEDWAETNLGDAIASEQLTYYRADGFNVFRMAHAKNIAHKLAAGSIVCNLDADNFLGDGFAEFLLETFQKPEPLFVRSPISRGTHGRIAFKKTDFEALGGYDERMSHGWGFEDQDIIRRACLSGLRSISIPTDRGFLEALSHSHKERTVFASTSDRLESNREHKRIAGENAALNRQVVNQGSGWGVAPVCRNFEPAPDSAAQSEKLHVGCGRHRLPSWLNHDSGLDIRKVLPFANESLRFIFAEHVVEHVTPAEAWHFFREARRVLKPTGVLRVVVPCVDLIVSRFDAEYAKFLRRKTRGAGSCEEAIGSIIVNWGHKAVWTVQALSAVLRALNFRVLEASPGNSHYAEMIDIDGHAHSIGHHANWVESGVVEAVK